jgi:hypothetical protein
LASSFLVFVLVEVLLEAAYPSISTGGIDRVTNCFATVFGNFACDDAAPAVLPPIQSATSSL